MTMLRRFPVLFHPVVLMKDSNALFCCVSAYQHDLKPCSPLGVLAPSQVTQEDGADNPDLEQQQVAQVCEVGARVLVAIDARTTTR